MRRLPRTLAAEAGRPALWAGGGRAALLAALALACADEGTLTRQGPDLAIDDAPLDFGTVPLGATKRIRLELANRGERALRVEELEIGAPFSAEIEATELAPGTSAGLDVAFSPARTEVATGALALRTNAAADPVRISLAGAGARAELRIVPSALDFGAVRLQATAAREFVLESATSAPVEGQIITESFPRREHFDLTFVPAFGDPAPFSLGGLDQQVLTLEFGPFVEGRNDGRILFEFCGDRCGVWVDVVAEAITSRLRIDPPVLSFGEVGIDGAQTEQVVVRNVGDTSLDVAEVFVRGSDELSFTSDAPFPATLQPNGFLTLRVTYAPFTAREIDARLIVRTTDPDVGRREVPVFGAGAGPRFAVQPELLQFGVVDAGITRRSLLMINAGSSALSVDALSLSGDPAYRLVDPPPLPIRLGSGDTSIVPVEIDVQRTGTFTATVALTTTDPGAPRTEVPVRAFRGDRLCRLEARPASLNFGVVSPGLTRRAPIEFENVGNEDCRIEAVALRAPADPFFRIVDALRPEVVAPGEDLVTEVEFSPTDDRDAKAALLVVTNDPLAPRRAVNLLGTGLAYVNVFVEPAVIDFGALRPDCNEGIDDIMLRNAGDASVKVDAVELDAPAAGVALSGPHPVVVQGGESAGWTVSWRPSVPGLLETDVVFEFADLPFPLRVPVTGEASFDARTTDVFQQRDVTSADVLFVIDNSCSMQDDQQALAANAETFIREADVREAKYRIGVTTTSEWPDQGRLVGPVIDRARLTDAEVIAEFQRQARVGTGGSGIEEGAASVVAALRKAERGNQPNAGLLRFGASLAVIIVTDEDDSSPAPMLSYYRDIIDVAPKDLVFAVVSGGPGGCGTALPTPRYQQLLRLTGGEHVSICDDWGENLEELGEAAFAPLSEFELRAPPEPTLPVEVRVDGQLVDTSTWSRAAGSRTIVFDEPPPPRSRIRVSYVPRCR